MVEREKKKASSSYIHKSSIETKNRKLLKSSRIIVAGARSKIDIKVSLLAEFQNNDK